MVWPSEDFGKIEMALDVKKVPHPCIRRRVKEEGGAVALSSLQPRYHELCLQWMYRNGEVHTAFSRVL